MKDESLQKLVEQLTLEKIDTIDPLMKEISKTSVALLKMGGHNLVLN